MARAIAYIKAQQEPDGSWYGRWGVNYIYGVWSALIALNMAGESPDQPAIHRAIRWLNQIQNQDGGFGETTDDYIYHRYAPAGKSVPSQTAWALMALTAAGQTHPTARAAPPHGFWKASRRADCGATPSIPARASRACFTCNIMAIRRISRSSPWRAGAT